MQIDLRSFENLPQHIYVFAVILGVLILAFVLFFVVPSFVVSWRLSRVTKRVRKLDGKTPSEIGEAFGKKGVLPHLWREYSHTLHAQTVHPELTPASDPNQTKSASDPSSSILRWRSTVPAEALFRPEIVVDTPLKTEFFRHLPGLFTGVGIIGTFFGLLMGLRAFQVSENPVVVRDSLNSLLHGVYEAFLVSAVAIALAMIVTLIERLVIARLYAKVEKLVQVLDSLFEAGAGEEYLARLVKASESSTAQNTVLKDALAAELRQALTELNDRQIAATHALGERLGQTIEAGLKAPLLEVAEGLRGLRTEQWGAVQGMLDQVMSGHTRQLQGLFGEQVTGIHALEAKTIDTLNTAVTKLEQMAMNVESAGTRGASAMSDRLEQALVNADSRQRSMNDTMAEFVQQIRNVVAQSQGETQGRLQGTLDDLSNRMREVIESLSQQVQATTETSRQHHDALANQTSRMVGEVGGQVSAIVDGVNRAVAEMKSAVEQMASNLEGAGTRGASAMSAQLGQALEAAESRQRALNDTTAEFVQHIRTAVAQSHAETEGRLQGTLDQLSARMNQVTESLSQQVQQTTETSRQHHDALANQTSRMVGEVGGQVGAIVDGVNRAVHEMKAAVDAMQRTTNDALVALNMGANTVSTAAEDFAKAGQAVSGAIEKSDVVADRLAQAAQSVAGVSRGLTSVVTDYQGARDAIGELVGSLQKIVEQARRETIMSDEVIARIESATGSLADAQREAGTYLARVSDVLGQAHGAFSQGVRQTLEDVNKDFHRQLSESVKLLRGGIQELQAAVETVNR
jgi:ABC-type transporter Mla subunit MlaD